MAEQHSASRLGRISADADAQAAQLRRRRRQPVHLEVERAETLLRHLAGVPAAVGAYAR